MLSIIAKRPFNTRCNSPELADKFIGMYVNHWTLDYGEKGRRAVRELLSRGAAIGLVPPSFRLEFLSEAA